MLDGKCRANCRSQRGPAARRATVFQRRPRTRRSAVLMNHGRIWAFFFIYWPVGRGPRSVTGSVAFSSGLSRRGADPMFAGPPPHGFDRSPPGNDRRRPQPGNLRIRKNSHATETRFKHPSDRLVPAAGLAGRDLGSGFRGPASRPGPGQSSLRAFALAWVAIPSTAALCMNRLFRGPDQRRAPRSTSFGCVTTPAQASFEAAARPQ